MFQSDWDGVGTQLHRTHQFNITYTPFINNKALFSESLHCQTFDVHFSMAHLQRLAPFYPLLDSFLNLVVKETPAQLSPAIQFATPQMLHTINDIFHYHRPTERVQLYMPPKVEELLLLSLDHLSEGNSNTCLSLNNYDLDCLHAVKELLQRDFEAEHSLQSLSRHVGINEFKLKKGFKQLFGTSVFDYLLQLKMRKAAQLLLETDLSIQEVGFMLGYDYVSNFTTAFKRQYQLTPAGYRKTARKQIGGKHQPESEKAPTKF